MVFGNAPRPSKSPLFLPVTTFVVTTDVFSWLATLVLARRRKTGRTDWLLDTMAKLQLTSSVLLGIGSVIRKCQSLLLLSDAVFPLHCSLLWSSLRAIHRAHGAAHIRPEDRHHRSQSLVGGEGGMGAPWNDTTAHCRSHCTFDPASLGVQGISETGQCNIDSKCTLHILSVVLQKREIARHA